MFDELNLNTREVLNLFTPNSSEAFDTQESSGHRLLKKSHKSERRGGVIRIEKKPCNQRDHRAGGGDRSRVPANISQEGGEPAC